MRLLVTGGAGYIGSVVTSQLLRAGHQVVVLDDLSTGHADAVPEGARWVQGRIQDAGDVRQPRHWCRVLRAGGAGYCREVTGHPIPAVERDRRPGDPPTLVASDIRARELLGWTPRLDLHRLVADAWAFLRDGTAPTP